MRGVRADLNRWILSALLVGAACGDDDDKPWPGTAGAGDDGSSGKTSNPRAGTSGGAESPTRTCVLNGSCGTCYGDDVCWEGYKDCDTREDTPNYSEKTCPELGFPVNCSGQNRFQPKGTTCSSSGSGGSGSSGGGKGRPLGEDCSSDGDCAAGLRCWYYLGEPANGKSCLEPCKTHADCSGATSPKYVGAFSACFSCTDDVFGSPTPGQEHCVPLGVCGGDVGAAACDDCLDSCQGLPSCCTGCGCICESECGDC